MHTCSAATTTPRSVFFLGGAILVTRTAAPKNKPQHKGDSLPTEGSTNGRLSSLVLQRRRQTTASRNARFMLVAAICVACLDIEIRARKSTLSAASSTTPTMLPHMSIECRLKLKCRSFDAGILLFTIIISYGSNIVAIYLHWWPYEPAPATGGERLQTIFQSS